MLILESLIGAKDYRSFIRAAVAHQVETRKASLTSISRRAGFTSRSFIKDVIDGRRRLTPLSITNFKKGLRLSGSWAQLFEFLVALEEPDVNFDQLSEHELRERIAKLRKKLSLNLKKGKRFLNFVEVEDIFTRPEVYSVFAALGTQQDGASLDEISLKTGFAKDSCQDLLTALTKEQIAVIRDGRYFASESVIDIFGSGKRDRFRRMYGSFAQDLYRRTAKSLGSPDEFFYCAALSIKTDDMKKLKERIRESIIEVLDEAQDDGGDRIAKVVVGLYF